MPKYLRTAGKLLTDTDQRAIVDHLAAHPAAGDLTKAERNALAGLVGALVETWLER